MGLVRPDDLAALRRLRQPEQQDGDEDGTGNDVSASDDEPDEQPTAYSAALIEELTAIRTAAMRVEMVNRPQVALAAMLYPLVVQVFHDGPRYLRPASSVEISGDLKDLTPAIKEPEACAALTSWNDIRDKWSYDVPGKADDLWEWLLEQPLDCLSDLLAVVVAANINAVEAKHDHVRDRLAHADKLAAAVHLDMRRHWSAKAPFLSRLSKAQIVEVMTEAGCSKSAIKAAGKASKAEAVTMAEEAMKTKSWLPSKLQSQSCEE